MILQPKKSDGQLIMLAKNTFDLVAEQYLCLRCQAMISYNWP